MARDAAHVFGWRYQPAIQFERGEGIWLYDVDGARYYDLTAGMMCNVLGHCHPELVEVMREEAGRSGTRTRGTPTPTSSASPSASPPRCPRGWRW